LSKFMNPVGEKRITQKIVAEMIGYKMVDIHRFINNTLKSYKSDMIDKLWELIASETEPDQEDEKIWQKLAEDTQSVSEILMTGIEEYQSKTKLSLGVHSTQRQQKKQGHC